jgi:V-type H+-transporting ATPase subunit a
MIRDRVARICDSFMGQRFEVPALTSIGAECNAEKLKITNSKQLLEMSEKQLVDYLLSINRSPRLEGAPNGPNPSRLELYAFYMAKEKAILSCINMLKQRDANDITLTGFIWAPLNMEIPIKFALQKFPAVEFNSYRQNSEEELPFTPPTYFKDNDVITIPQLITNTYGIPDYGEANPACFTIVLFPFLFAVMFGDYGHGSLILFIGTILVLGHDYF